MSVISNLKGVVATVQKGRNRKVEPKRGHVLKGNNQDKKYKGAFDDDNLGSKLIIVKPSQWIKTKK